MFQTMCKILWFIVYLVKYKLINCKMKCLSSKILCGRRVYLFLQWPNRCALIHHETLVRRYLHTWSNAIFYFNQGLTLSGTFYILRYTFFKASNTTLSDSVIHQSTRPIEQKSKIMEMIFLATLIYKNFRTFDIYCIFQSIVE
jgi:hypothetical protein